MVKQKSQIEVVILIFCYFKFSDRVSYADSALTGELFQTEHN